MPQKPRYQKNQINQESRSSKPVEPDSETMSLQNVLRQLKELEVRIAHIELQLGLGKESNGPASTAVDKVVQDDREDALETWVGESWFARVGIAVFSFGVVFLLTLPFQHIPSYIPSLIGYTFVFAMVALSRYWSASYRQVARYLLGGALLLLYFTTLRLFHFGPTPVLAGGTLELVLLAAVVILDIIIALSLESSSLLVLSLTLGFLTALVAQNPFVTFVVIVAMTMLSSGVALLKKWHWILVPVLALAYLTHFIWSIHNPLLGNQIQQVSAPLINLAFVLLYAIIFGVGDLLSVEKEKEDGRLIVDAVLNGFGSYVLLSILTVTGFKDHFALWHLLASCIYIVFAISFWRKAKTRYVTFLYAMLGYGALSVAIISLFTVPDVFVWLCWQSVLVLTTAVWFRSRFIVVANFIIYLAVYFAYLLLAGTFGVISVSFGVVALLSARILNWKKDRLELRTEMMRNAYLASALFVLPYALYHVLPAGYVSTSWLGLALFYYLAGRFLKNRKYRWMALLTIFLTLLYVLTVDLVGIDPVIRVVSFLVLGSTLLTVSMIYSRRSRNARHT